MSKKKRPNQHSQKTVTVPIKPAIVMHQTPVTHGDVFVTFLREAQSIGNEVEARRQMCADVEAFLNEKGLAEQFKAWRAARAEV